MRVWPENRGLENGLPNLGPKELIFCPIMALGTEIWPNFRLQIDFETLKYKFSKNQLFLAKTGSWRTDNFWNGGHGGREKGS